MYLTGLEEAVVWKWIGEWRGRWRRRWRGRCRKSIGIVEGNVEVEWW